MTKTHRLIFAFGFLILGYMVAFSAEPTMADKIFGTVQIILGGVFGISYLTSDE